MSLDLPVVDPVAMAADADRLDRALRLVWAAREDLAAALDAPPAGPEASVGSWRDAVTARGRDLSRTIEVLEHARNVLGKTAAVTPELVRQHAAGGGDETVLELVQLLALGADQLVRMSEVTVAAVPADPPADGVPLGPEHVLADGTIRVG